MLSFLLNRYTWFFGAILAALVGGFVAGVSWEGNLRDAQQLRIERQAREALERQRVEWDRQKQEISLELARRRSENLALERKLNGRIAHVRTSELVAFERQSPDRAAGAAAQRDADPDAVALTPRFVGLYNSALARVPETAGGADGADPAGGAVGARELLANLNQNGAEFQACRDQLKAWQDWARNSGLAG